MLPPNRRAEDPATVDGQSPGKEKVADVRSTSSHQADGTIARAVCDCKRDSGDKREIISNHRTNQLHTGASAEGWVAAAAAFRT